MSDLFNGLIGGSAAALMVIVVLGLSALGFYMARSRAMASGNGDRRNLHSLPNYYGWNAAMLTAVPALGVLVIWLWRSR